MARKKANTVTPARSISTRGGSTLVSTPTTAVDALKDTETPSSRMRRALRSSVAKNKGKPEAIEADEEAGSDMEVEDNKAKIRTAPLPSVVKGKRKADEIEGEDEVKHEAEVESKRPEKKRVVSQIAYVEIPLRRTASKSSVAPQPAINPRAKGKAKAPDPPPSDAESDDVPLGRTASKSSAAVQTAIMASAKGKGKAPAPPPTDSESALTDIETDEEAPMSMDESSLSDDGDDFVPEPEKPRRSPRKKGKGKAPIILSDEDSADDNGSVFEDDLAGDSEEEEQMLQQAIQKSLKNVASEEDEPGPSTSSPAKARRGIVRRAGGPKIGGTKADGRKRRGRKAPKVASDFEDLDGDEAMSSADDEDGGKAYVDAISVTVQGISRANAWIQPDIEEGVRQSRPEDKVDRLMRKSEETRLKRKLGRKKLTQAERNTIALHMHHPELRNCWGDLESAIPILVPEKAAQPEGLKLQLLPFQQESLSWMRKQEKGVWQGGMLADEMGMGKTIQTIALLVSDRQKPNLIVAPTVAIMQWRNEIETHTDGFSVCIWHGASRSNDVEELAKYDVVLTTYAVLESCFRKQQSGFKRKGHIVKEKSALHCIEWQRIILDEAHNIKERSTNTAKGAFELKGKSKWCLSGTPLQNRVGELYSLVRFLGGEPFSFYFCMRCDCKSLHWRFSDKRSCDTCGHSPMNTCFWNNEILSPIQKFGMEGAGKLAFKKLKILLDRMMLRRTKLERADDLGLPPRTVIVRRDYFSPEEKELYLSLFSDAKRTFSTYVNTGTLLNNYSNIFSLITRMRQMACHPDLVLKSKTNKAFSDQIVEATVCRICNDIAEDAIKSKCNHIFDRECIKQYLNTAVEQQPQCPVCRLPLSIDLEAPALEEEAAVNGKVRQGILGRLDMNTWRSSSKIEALVEELTNLRNRDSTTKSIVFSQFVNFLDLISFRLQRAGFVICRLEGTMSPQARDATIKHFMNNTYVTVFLVSLKAGGVALNLTEASRVYLMDSWWNPAVEYQAMDRIHRLGQHRPVEAIKLVVEDSIESRIVQLQEKKTAMVDATLQRDDSAMGRLTPEDLGFLFRL